MTFFMSEMVPLRCVAILSSTVWLAFGWAEQIYPILLVHAILFPLNTLRLRQALLLRGRQRDVVGGLSGPLGSYSNPGR